MQQHHIKRNYAHLLQAGTHEIMINKTKPALDKKPTEVDTNENFCISLEHFDNSQGQGFKDWQGDGLLSKAMEVLYGYCKSKLMQQVDGDKFVIYGDFPPKDKTKFHHPDHVPQDANWARIHINNKSIIVGHVVRNKFYVVFLDKKHQFWVSQKKHT